MRNACGRCYFLCVIVVIKLSFADRAKQTIDAGFRDKRTPAISLSHPVFFCELIATDDLLYSLSRCLSSCWETIFLFNCNFFLCVVKMRWASAFILFRSGIMRLDRCRSVFTYRRINPTGAGGGFFIEIN